MAVPYIPSRDADLSVWAGNFVNVLTLNQPTYLITGVPLTTLQANVASYQAALIIASDPGTKTKVTVATKDAARTVMLSNIRLVASQIQSIPGITPGDLSAAGLTVRDTSRTPIPPPVTFPIISLLGVAGGQLRLALSDELTPLARRKPVGVLNALLVVKASPGTPADSYDGIPLATVGRVPTSISLAPLTANTVYNMVAVWLNRRGDRGPLSAPVAFNTL